jgi:hypothetical protein
LPLLRSQSWLAQPYLRKPRAIIVTTIAIIATLSPPAGNPDFQSARTGVRPRVRDLFFLKRVLEGFGG